VNDPKKDITVDNFKDRLNKAHEEAIQLKQERQARFAEEERPHIDFDNRFDDLVEKLWQVVEEVVKPTKLKTHRKDGRRALFLEIYNPKDTQGHGKYVRIGSFLNRQEYKLVAGIILKRRLRNKTAKILSLDDEELCFNTYSAYDEKIKGLELCKMTGEKIIELVRRKLEDNVLDYVREHPDSI
jgi:hypothetical protein